MAISQITDILGSISPIQKLLVIDTQIANWESLAAGADANTAVLILDPATDGLTQISDYISSLTANANTQGFTPLDSIQIMSHGSTGSLLLGSATVNNSNLTQYTSQLSTLGNALSATGDIFLYGCNVAASQAGLDFINQIAALTGADVAASNDITGAAALGGNWQLEVSTGAIEATTAINTTALAAYSGVLVANTIIANNTAADEAFLVVYDSAYVNGDSTLGRTYNRDLGVSYSQLVAAGTNNLSLLNTDLTTDANWTAFQLGMTASAKWAVVDGSLADHGTFVTGNIAPTANIDPTNLIFDAAAIKINQHALEVDNGLSLVNSYQSAITGVSSLVKQQPDPLNGATGQAAHAGLPFSSLWTGINTSGTGFDPLSTVGATAQFYKGGTHLDFVTDYSGYGPDPLGTLVTTAADIINVGQLQLTATGLAAIPFPSGNTAPTFTQFTGNIGAGNENTQKIEVTFANLILWGDEADVNGGSVTAFVIKAVTAGTLMIGSTAANATPWDVSTNNFVDATHQAYWTPLANTTGNLPAFTAVAKDNGGLESITPVQAKIAVTSLNTNHLPTGSVTITGTAVLGQVLTVSNTLTDVDGMGTVAYQWLAGGTAITGATAATFTLTQVQVDKAITVTASYTDLLSHPESVSSNSTPVVKASNSPVTPVISDTNHAPTLTLPKAISYTDTIFDDTFNTETGLLSAGDIDPKTTLTYGITDGIENSAHTTISKTGSYGTLTVTKATGAYNFVANDNTIEPLNAVASDVFTVTTSDGSLSASQKLTINIVQDGKTESIFNDNLTGNNANNKFDGWEGNDTIKGLGGNDSIKGGLGNDFITGGLGADKLTGGTGKDTFDFNSSLEIGKGAKKDSILDFSHNQHDKIDLSGIDAKIGTKANDKFAFIGSSAFHHKAGELHFVKGILSGDTNGDAKADFEMQIVGVQKLVPADFAL